MMTNDTRTEVYVSHKIRNRDC